MYTISDRAKRLMDRAMTKPVSSVPARRVIIPSVVTSFRDALESGRVSQLQVRPRVEYKSN